MTDHSIHFFPHDMTTGDNEYARNPPPLAMPVCPIVLWGASVEPAKGEQAMTDDEIRDQFKTLFRTDPEIEIGDWCMVLARLERAAVRLVREVEAQSKQEREDAALNALIVGAHRFPEQTVALGDKPALPRGPMTRERAIEIAFKHGFDEDFSSEAKGRAASAILAACAEATAPLRAALDKIAKYDGPKGTTCYASRLMVAWAQQALAGQPPAGETKP